MDPLDLSIVDFIDFLLGPLQQKDIFMVTVVCHLDTAASEHVLLLIRLIILLCPSNSFCSSFTKLHSIQLNQLGYLASSPYHILCRIFSLIVTI